MADKPKTPDVNFFQKYAIETVRNDWPIVLLGHASKKPLENGWQKKDIGLSEVKRICASGKKYGIGIKCGNIIGIDNDYEEGGPVTKEFIEAVQELTDHYFPDALLRRGRPERLPLRCVRIGGDTPVKSTDIGKVQIIGKGRQFVAYNRHPDTGKSYVWLKSGSGAPASVPMSDVPTYGTKVLQEFVSALLLLEETFGLAPDQAGDVLRRIKAGEKVKPRQLQAERRLVEYACEYIKDEPEWGWDEWNNNIMMSLWNASEGDEWGLALAHKLSSQHDAYEADEVDKRWDEISKSPPSLLGWPRLNWLARMNGMPFLGPKDWDDYMLIENQDAFFGKRTKQWTSIQMFNNLFARQKTKGLTPVQTFLESRVAQRFDAMVWEPRLESGSAEHEGMTVWNTWTRPDWYGEEGSGSIEPWIWLVRNVYMEEWELAVKRMAFDVQYPEERPQWHLMATGENGIGKSDCLLPLARWAQRFGLLSSINSDALKSTFNTYLSRKKVILIEEPGGITDAVFNELKNMLAGNSRSISIHEKFRNPRDEAIVASFYFGGNRQDAVSLTQVERRIHPVHSRAQRPTVRNGLLKDAIRRHAWLEKNWPRVIWYLKHDVEVDKSFGSAPPPPNKYQMAIAEMTAPMHLRLASKLKEYLNGYVLFTVEGIEGKLLEDRELSVEAGELKRQMIIKALHGMGAVRCLGGKQIRFGEGARRRVWSIDPTLENAKSDEIRQNWEFLGMHEES